VQERVDALVHMYQNGLPEERDYARSQLDLLTRPAPAPKESTEETL
jgi:hypothetical protein